MESYRETSANKVDEAIRALSVIKGQLDTMPEDKRALQLTNIAYASANEGLWEEFAAYFGQETAKSQLENLEDAKKPDWIKQFMNGGYPELAYPIATTIKDKKLQAAANFNIAYGHAKRGELLSTITWLNRIDQKRDSTVMGSLFQALETKEEFELADSILTTETIHALYVFEAATISATKRNYERFEFLIRLGLERFPTMSDRIDPDTGDYIIPAITTAAKTAFMIGDMNFLLGLKNLTDWKDVKNLDKLITSGVIEGIIESQNYEAAVDLFIAKAIEVEENDAYPQLQKALEKRNWPEIMELSSEVNTEILGALHQIAYQESELEYADELSVIIRERGPYTGNYIFISDEVALSMISEAKEGNWDEVFFLRSNTRALWAEKNARELIEYAVEQARFDVLPEIIRDNQLLAHEAHRHLDADGYYDQADELRKDWLKAKSHEVSEEELIWEEIMFITSRPEIAANRGDWQQAFAAIKNYEKLLRSGGDNSPHRQYEHLTIIAFKMLRQNTSG